MSNTYFDAIHYDIHLDMKLDYTMSRNFQEMSLSELETLHHLHSLHNPHPLSLVPQSYRNTLLITELASQSINFQRSPVSHKTLHLPCIDDTYD